MPPPGVGRPEEYARQEIDKLLTEAGWIVQNRDEINLTAGRGIAIREFRLADGFGYADYLLFVDERPVGALEAKPLGHSLGGVEPQVQKYASGVPSNLTAPVLPLPFLYLSTSADTRFINLLDPDPRTRKLVQNRIHRPETLAEWLSASPLAQWASERESKAVAKGESEDTREQVQQERIASLEGQVAALAKGIESAAEGGGTARPDHSSCGRIR